jgi:hypothetical protein
VEQTQGNGVEGGTVPSKDNLTHHLTIPSYSYNTCTNCLLRNEQLLRRGDSESRNSASETTGENTDVTTANTNGKDASANDENAKTREQGRQEQDTWIQVVDRRSKKKNKDKQIVSRHSLSRNNPVN